MRDVRISEAGPRAPVALGTGLLLLCATAAYLLVAFGSRHWMSLATALGGREARRWVPVPILVYHEIGDTRSLLVLSRQDFARELDFLSVAGYTPITLKQLYTAARGHTASPGRTVVLTFDDGYESFYQYAFPLLRQHRYPATVFVSTGLVGHPGYLTWDQVRQLSQAGIEIEAHTVTHPDLRTLNDSQLWAEIVGSRDEIAAHLGRPPEFFSYPYGSFNSHVEEVVRRAGFKAAVTGLPGAVTPLQDPYRWPRNVVVRGAGYWRIWRLLRSAYRHTYV